MTEPCPHCHDLREERDALKEQLIRAKDANRYLAWANRQLTAAGLRIERAERRKPRPEPDYSHARVHRERAAHARPRKRADIKRPGSGRGRPGIAGGGLTLAVLRLIAAHDGLVPTRLREMLSKSKAQITNALANCARHGWVRSEKASGFRRGKGKAEHRWYITDAGRQAIDQAVQQ